jgi:TPR repeat protein
MIQSYPHVIEPDLTVAISKWQFGDYSSCFPIIKRHAQKNNAHAQFIMGSSFYTQFGLPKDLDQAVYWLERAVENGHPIAPLHLAMLVDPANELAEEKRVSAEKAAGLYQLGFERCKSGAEAGNAHLMAALAGCYSLGLGTERDQALAEKWGAEARAAGYRWPVA